MAAQYVCLCVNAEVPLFRAHEHWGLDEPPTFVTFAKKMLSGGFYHTVQGAPYFKQVSFRIFYHVMIISSHDVIRCCVMCCCLEVCTYRSVHMPHVLFLIFTEVCLRT